MAAHPPVFDSMQEINLFLLGPSFVGKTSLIKRFTRDTFLSSTLSHMLDFDVHRMTIDGTEIKFKLWDPPGQDRFFKVIRSFYDRQDGFIFVYDSTDRKSYDELFERIKDVEERFPGFIGTVVAAKCDFDEEKVVSTRDAEYLAGKFNMTYFETSAKYNHNVELIFGLMARRVLEKRARDANNTKEAAELATILEQTAAIESATEPAPAIEYGTSCLLL